MENEIKTGQLRIWWITNTLQERIQVKSLAEGIHKLNERANLELADSNVVWNTGGIELYDTQHIIEADDAQDGFTEHYAENGIDVTETKDEIINLYGINFTLEQTVEFLKNSSYKSESSLVTLY
jgi:hypothetical protein